jgi:glycerol-3-phosphate dehydrogenase (NAD(P)+)
MTVEPAADTSTRQRSHPPSLRPHPSGVCVVGVTAWGLTLAQLFAGAGGAVCLLARNEGEAETVRRLRTEPRRIAEVRLPASVRVTASPDEASVGAGIAILAVPSQALRENARRVSGRMGQGCIAVSAAKGIELGTGLRMSQVLREELPEGTPVLALSGPNLAGEIARGLPAATVVAGPDDAAVRVQGALASPSFRVYTHDDIVGVELGGALKNIIALAAGICDSLGYGDNAKAGIVTRGLAEITRLGGALGANPLTFAGLSGLGDVTATCASPLSRNRRVGEALGRGMPLNRILAELDHVAEGVSTTAAAVELARRLGVELPIAETMDRLLRGEITAVEGVRALMEREVRSEL